MPQFTLKELLGEDDYDNHVWSVRELENMSTEELKDLADIDAVNDFIKEHNPDTHELRSFLYNEITGGR